MKLKVKVDTKGIEKAVAREARAAIADKKFEVMCKYCGRKVNVPQGKSPCPFCGGIIDLTVNFNF